MYIYIKLLHVQSLWGKTLNKLLPQIDYRPPGPKIREITGFPRTLKVFSFFFFFEVEEGLAARPLALPSARPVLFCPCGEHPSTIGLALVLRVSGQITTLPAHLSQPRPLELSKVSRGPRGPWSFFAHIQAQPFVAYTS